MVGSAETPSPSSGRWRPRPRGGRSPHRRKRAILVVPRGSNPRHDARDPSPRATTLGWEVAAAGREDPSTEHPVDVVRGGLTRRGSRFFLHPSGAGLVRVDTRVPVAGRARRQAFARYPAPLVGARPSRLVEAHRSWITWAGSTRFTAPPGRPASPPACSSGLHRPRRSAPGRGLGGPSFPPST